jgi:hypothetical protein
MFRIHLARFFLLGAALFAAGCSSDRPGLFSSCSSCGSQPGLWSRMRASSSTQPVSMQGDCCNDRIVSGPYVPPMQPMQPTTIIPAPQSPQSTIPRIDENAKQMPYDPNKMSRPGTTTSNDGTTKTGN